MVGVAKKGALGERSWMPSRAVRTRSLAAKFGVFQPTTTPPGPDRAGHDLGIIAGAGEVIEDAVAALEAQPAQHLDRPPHLVERDVIGRRPGADGGGDVGAPPARLDSGSASLQEARAKAAHDHGSSPWLQASEYQPAGRCPSRFDRGAAGFDRRRF